MILSMTGFAAVAAELPGCSLAVELRSVNHRYLDLQLRVPDELRTLETAIRESLARELKRGKIDCRISLNRTTPGAAALAIYYAIVVVLLMDGRGVLAHYAEFGTYSGLAEQLAIAAGGLIVYAASAKIDAALAARLTRLGQLAFGVCALLFGGAHFFYMNLTAPLVPKWLPPTQEFWVYATGIAHVAAGAAILTGVQARLAAILLTAMYASFTLLVHSPMLLADPSSRMNWSENALNLALIGAAWVVADSLARGSKHRAA
jgi:uncharacterized membrane protein YphA (DoxX/SURF4 family)